MLDGSCSSGENTVFQRHVCARRLWYLPSLLLLVVACNQLRLACTTALSPWWGGGFGMFATTDAWGTRHVHAFAIRPGVRRELAIPSSLRREVQRALTLPSDSQLRDLAHKLAEVPTPDEGALEAIELQVWATRFAPDTLEPSGFLLRSFSVPLSAP
jgi:hypothetical protein